MIVWHFLCKYAGPTPFEVDASNSTGADPGPLSHPYFMKSSPHVAVVGATGAVGIELIRTLERRNFPVGKLTLLASARSVGKKLTFRGP